MNSNQSPTDSKDQPRRLMSGVNVPFFLIGLALAVVGQTIDQSGGTALTIVGIVFVLLSIIGVLGGKQDRS